MRFGSVCSGIEAASVAWHPLGWKAAWLSEIEPFPSAVLKHHYPDVPNHGDMTTLPERILSGEVEAPDLFCGGTPCQAFSVAGLRNSLDDARGNLSLTFVGIANAIDHVRSLRRDAPAIIFWENVPGVLSTRDNAFGCFLGALAGEDDPIIPTGEKWTNAGCVYGPQRTVAWRVLDAQYFGVAQRRRRVFVVASARADFNPAAVLFEFNGLRRDTAPSREAGKEASASARTGATFSCAGIGTYTEDNAAATLLKSGQDLGNGCEALVSQTVQTLRCRRPGEGGMSGDDEHLIPVISPALNTQSGSHHAPDTKAYVVQALPINTQIAMRHNALGERTGFGVGEAGDPAFTLTKGHSHAVAHAFKVRGGCEGGGNGYLGSDDVAFTISTTQDQQVAQPVFSFIQASAQKKSTNSVLEGLCNTLTARAENNSFLGGQAMAVRRLTPVECERLQGFPDGYTDIKLKGKPTSDGPRYKALGNSWAVPVVRWIGKRIQDAI